LGSHFPPIRLKGITHTLPYAQIIYNPTTKGNINLEKASNIRGTVYIFSNKIEIPKLDKPYDRNKSLSENSET